MLKSFLVLGLPMDASDVQIRKKYLKLVKIFAPEKAPEQFQRITTAYEAVKDSRRRTETTIFTALMDMEYDETFSTLTKSVKIRKKQTGLKDLLKALDK
jgi:curved DNA-binding protein CbpA